MKKYLFSLSLVVLFGCKSGPKNLNDLMVDITEFQIDNSILEDGDYVRILGCSGNLTREHEIDFYNLIVVVSERTGDTLNVLVTNYYQVDENDPNTRFISNSSLVGKLLEGISDNGSIDVDNVNDLKSKSFDKVLYDSEYIQIDVRNYTAVTGNLGDFIIEDNKDSLGI